MNRSEERRKAAELKAVDVRDLIRRSLPDVLPLLGQAQIDQLQRVLDVAAINGALDARGSALDQRSIKGKIMHSNEYLRDPAMVAQRNNVLAQKLGTKPGENAVLLEFHRLVMPDALKPTSDNPDEAAYLLVVADVYLHRGVWIVLDSSSAAMTQQMGPTDPRKWRVRLLLGFKPGALVEEITAGTGRLSRKALLSASKIGAGYHEWVHDGPTMKALERSLKQVRENITRGRDEHIWWSNHRDQFPVVSKISDTVGRADWPNEAIWEQPHKIHVQALQLKNDGKLAEAAKFGLLAAYQAQWCAQAVSSYIEATLSGASRVRSLLEVVAAIGKVAESILEIWFVGRGIFRMLTRKSATLALEGSAQRQLPPGRPTGGPSTVPGSPTPTGVKPGPQTVGYGPQTAAPARNPAGRVAIKDRGDLGESVDQIRQQLGLPPRQGGTHFGLVGASESKQLNEARKAYMDWLVKNPDASLAEKMAKHDRDIVARFGHLD